MESAKAGHRYRQHVDRPEGEDFVKVSTSTAGPLRQSLMRAHATADHHRTTTSSPLPRHTSSSLDVYSLRTFTKQHVGRQQATHCRHPFTPIMQSPSQPRSISQIHQHPARTDLRPSASIARQFVPAELDVDDLAEAVRLLLSPGVIPPVTAINSSSPNLLRVRPRVSHVVEAEAA